MRAYIKFKCLKLIGRLAITLRMSQRIIIVIDVQLLEVLDGIFQYPGGICRPN